MVHPLPPDNAPQRPGVQGAVWQGEVLRWFPGCDNPAAALAIFQAPARRPWRTMRIRGKHAGISDPPVGLARSG